MTDRELMQQALQQLKEARVQLDGYSNLLGDLKIYRTVMNKTISQLENRLIHSYKDSNQLQWQKQQTEHWKQHCFDLMKKLQEKNGV